MQIVLTPKERKLLTVVVIFAVLVLIVPGVGLQYTNDYLRVQQTEKRNLEKSIVDLNNRLDGIEDERRAVRENRENYLYWVNEGVVGEQDPVVWVKTMQNIQEERFLFPVKYDLANEELLESSASPLTSESTVRLRLQEMQTEMAMLHDMDMLMFMQSLDDELSSLFFPVECDFRLLEEEFSLVKRENMSSICRLVWVSAEDPEIRRDAIGS